MTLHRIFAVCFFTLSLCASGSEVESVDFVRNKQAIERAAKIYLAFEARHEIGPGAEADLKLPEKAKFKVDSASDSQAWVYPVALGLEVRIGEEQQKVLVISPEKSGGVYFLATEDLQVVSLSEEQAKSILVAIQGRLKKLHSFPGE